MASEKGLIPTGATDELSLRVSVATLVRVVFRHPKDGARMLGLERRATLLSDGEERRVVIKCQPFGGAVRLHSLDLLRSLLGVFHFDSERSRSERDFRIFIRPSDWDAVKEFCLRHFENGEDSVLETGPERELAEELADTLGIELQPEQYTCTPLKTMLENEPAATENVHATGYGTVRMYRVFEARILDPNLCLRMLENSKRFSNEELQERALEDAHQGGKGWANVVLTLPLEPLVEFYLGLSPGARNEPVYFGNHCLDNNVCAILEGVSAPKYTAIQESVQEDRGDLHS